MIWVILIIISVGLFLFSKKKNKPIEWTAEELKVFSDYSNTYPDEYRFSLRGLNVGIRNRVFKKCEEGDTVDLEAEPENKYDSNAIKVMADHGHIGYVPKEEAAYINKIIKTDHYVSIDEISENTEFGGEYDEERTYNVCMISIKFNSKNLNHH